MAGFFDTSGFNSDPLTGTSNNAAADFERLNAADPAQFDASGLFDKLFGKRKGRKEAAQAAIQASSGLGQPPQSNSQGTPTPAITSGPALVGRILGALAAPPQPMPPQAVPYQGAPGAAGPQGSPPPQPGSLPPFDLSPQTTDPQIYAEYLRRTGHMNLPGLNYAGMGTPPPRQVPSPYGGQTFGGNRFGGNTFGGNTFGGQRFGASAQPQGPMVAPPWQQGYARGGYPDHLMFGLPTRYDAGGSPSFVPDDGQGNGRSDHIQARLSPGEFVMDAETVSLLGDGDNAAGARKLEEMRQSLRQQKGAALARGAFSPDAKQPMSYLKRRK